MKNYKKEDVIGIYQRIVDDAKSKIDKNPIGALRDIETAGNWAYSFNFQYADLKLEAMVMQIAEQRLSGVDVDCPNGNRCVLIDSFCFDNRGLTQQYLRAMMRNDFEILFVCTRNDGGRGRAILKELKDYQKCEILCFSDGKNNLLVEAQAIIDRIGLFAPKYLFLHLTPYDTIALMACHRINGVEKYNINLTDHAFWMGVSFIDYNIEFRANGETISCEKRFLVKQQLLSLPYYPISPLDSSFDGFPALPEGCIKVFAGGALYKMLGKNDIFFCMMDEVLSVRDNVYMLVAGFDKSELFDEKVGRMTYGNRVVKIGRRQDIDEVFKHIDIYLSTFPAGGLMSQYAAKHGKPIIAYYDEKVTSTKAEDFVNIFGEACKSLTSMSALRDYAAKLVKDEEFRHEEGERLKSVCMTEEKFNESFMRVLNHERIIEWKPIIMNYDNVVERYLDLENNYGGYATQTLAVKKPTYLFTERKYRKQILKGYGEYIKSTPPHVLWSQFTSLLIRVARRLLKH